MRPRAPLPDLRKKEIFTFNKEFKIECKTTICYGTEGSLSISLNNTNDSTSQYHLSKVALADPPPTNYKPSKLRISVSATNYHLSKIALVDPPLTPLPLPPPPLTPLPLPSPPLTPLVTPSLAETK